LHSQTKASGPVIGGYGEVWTVKNPDFKTYPTKEYKVVFDIMNSSESYDQLNISIKIQNTRVDTAQIIQMKN